VRRILSLMATHSRLPPLFFSKKVGDLMDYSSRDRFKAVLEEDDIFTVMEILGHGTHRVAIVNVLSDIQNLITQSDVVRLIAANTHLLGDAAKRTVQELGFLNNVFPNKLVALNANEVALNSFKIMNTMKVGAAPILNEQGQFIGTLSVSDLKSLAYGSFESLLTTTADFSRKHAGSNIPSPIVCAPNDSVSYVLGLISQSRVHRVWVLDQNQHPVGVISLTDICRTVAALTKQQQ